MTLETQRLLLRKLEETDVERMFLLDSNPEVMKYIGVPVLTKPDESLDVIRMIQKQYEENGTGRLAVIEKETGLLIGWSGLKLLTEEINGYKNVLDLGYRYLPESWGKGYALEAAKASLELGFHEMKADVIYAHAHSGNDGSNHILRKLGFQKTGEFTEPDGICYWYELKSEKYKP
ncbi:GNAT family N-acetyltransferase [Chryseobacterium kwangjuense]|uniref:GNAT family acetyltransferase n=1 Tax=Chryseobacterium kwangjuense TaxID=267125 RepID=A0A135WKQ5_9FLAO|nr:GNAT family N-acetyltransferase [Chryseobacterium kwangjuense]KXH85352.1 GNAT family acetyltransferase [Chryseobacterium kwangjuense]